MKKNRVTEEDKEEFKKTTYGQKCYELFIIFVILLLVSCVLAGFLTGYGESGKILFEHQNIVLLLAIIIAIISAEQLGKCEGALNQYAINKKNNENNKEDESKKNIKKELAKEIQKEHEVKTISKNTKKVNDKKESAKKSYTKKSVTKSKNLSKVKNEK